MVSPRLCLQPARASLISLCGRLPQRILSCEKTASSANKLPVSISISYFPHLSKAETRSESSWACRSVSDRTLAEAEVTEPLGYRNNVGVCLVNRQGLVFAARRLDDSSQTWQMPQGGIDEGEDARAAAVRELTEETGVSSARIVAECPAWLQYDFPPEVLAIIRKANGRKPHRGQRQKWFLMFFEGEDGEIDLEQPQPEFSDYKWVSIHEMPLHVIPFKREVYEGVVKVFAPLIEQHVQNGEWVA